MVNIINKTIISQLKNNINTFIKKYNNRTSKNKRREKPSVLARFMSFELISVFKLITVEDNDLLELRLEFVTRQIEIGKHCYKSVKIALCLIA